jgi:hypothetical protein
MRLLLGAAIQGVLSGDVKMYCYLTLHLYLYLYINWSNTTIQLKSQVSLQLQILNQLLNYTFFKVLEQWLLTTKLSVVST